MDDPRLILRDWLITGSVPVPHSPEAADDLMAAAQAQGLTGLLADAVTAHTAWPLTARERLRQAARDCLVRTTRQLDLAARVHARLLRAGLHSLPLKGAAVAEWLYDSPAHRPMSDVDLLALDDPDASQRVLCHAGFRSITVAEHASVLADPETGGILELHRAVTSCPSLFPMDTHALWHRRLHRQGQLACVPSAVDLLVLLSLHASFQHGLVLTLSQWLDFSRLAAELDAPVAALDSLTSRAPTARAVALALVAAEIAVAAPISSALRCWTRQTLPHAMPAPLSARPSAPLALISPSRPHLARVRWFIASGCRRQLIAATLFPDAPAGAGSLWPRVASGVRRLQRIARHWI